MTSYILDWTFLKHHMDRNSTVTVRALFGCSATSVPMLVDKIRTIRFVSERGVILVICPMVPFGLVTYIKNINFQTTDKTHLIFVIFVHNNGNLAP